MNPRPRHRRETGHKDKITLPGLIPTATGSFAGSITVRKPLHHHKCRLCARRPNLRREDICLGNARCQCAGCEQIREAGAPPYTVRASELRRINR